MIVSWQLVSRLSKTCLATSRSSSRYATVERICCNLLDFLEERKKLEGAEALLGGSFVPAKRDKRSRKGKLVLGYFTSSFYLLPRIFI